MTVKQISVFLENRTGQLSAITRLLADEGINLRAISIAETADYGVLRLIADDAEKAVSALLSHEHILSVAPVTIVAVPDRPAGLAEVLDLLSEGGIAVEYMYSLFTHDGDTAYMVFRIADDDAFNALLKAHGITPVDPQTLGLK